MQSKSKQKKFLKFRFLLDTAFAKPSTFNKLCKRSVVKHVRIDFNLSRQAEDSEIYNLAVKNNMFVITMNWKHFKKLVRKNSPGVFVLDSGLSNNEIDVSLSDFIKGKNLKDYYGKISKVINQT